MRTVHAISLLLLLMKSCENFLTLQPSAIDFQTLENINGTLKVSNFPTKTTMNQTLLLSYDNFTAIENSALCASPFIGLFVQHSQLPTLTKNHFGTCPTLKSLSFYKNCELCFQNCTLEGLTTLESLVIDHQTIKQVDKDLFCGLESLIFLAITSANVELIEFDSFDDLRDLKVLHLYNNRLRKVGFFKNLEKLEELRLEGNDFEEFSLEDLKNLTKLKNLSISGDVLRDLTKINDFFPGLSSLYIFYEKNNRCKGFQSFAEGVKNGSKIEELVCVYSHKNVTKTYNF